MLTRFSFLSSLALAATGFAGCTTDVIKASAPPATEEPLPPDANVDSSDAAPPVTKPPAPTYDWVAVPGTPNGEVRSISGTSATNVWAIIGQGLQHFDGKTWREEPTGITQPDAVHAVSPTYVVVAGHDGPRGSANVSIATRMDAGPFKSAVLNRASGIATSIAADGTRVFVTTDPTEDGAASFGGSATVYRSPSPGTMFESFGSFGASAPNALFAVAIGSKGEVRIGGHAAFGAANMWTADGGGAATSTWSMVSTSIMTGEVRALYLLPAAKQNIVAANVADGSRVYTEDCAGAFGCAVGSFEAIGKLRAGYTVVGGTADSMLLVGDGGAMIAGRIVGMGATSFTHRTAPTKTDLRAVWGLPEGKQTSWWVGGKGGLFRYTQTN